MIPHFCYHPKLKPDANCRMCLVEVEKMPKLQTSCSTVAEGMAVRTATTVVHDAHKSVLEFILANHPVGLPGLRSGRASATFRTFPMSTPPPRRFVETKRIFQKEYFSPLIETQMNRCVQCLRCVRYCDEVMDVKALAPVRTRHDDRNQVLRRPSPGLRILRRLRADLPGRRHHQPALDVRISSLDAQTRRHDLHLLRRRLPDHGPDKGPRADRGEHRPTAPVGTTATCAREGFLDFTPRAIPAE